MSWQSPMHDMLAWMNMDPESSDKLEREHFDRLGFMPLAPFEVGDWQLTDMGNRWEWVEQRASKERLQEAMG